ncbi:MAG: MlaD family protein [Planctomycetota bacterium]|nr:MlaD family protein [Planctomycetota bacterium]
MTTELKVGFLFFVGLAALFVFTLAISDVPFLKKGYEFEIVFPDAAGIEKGDKVLLSGVTVGDISDLSFTEDGEVLMTCHISNEQTRIPADSRFMIKPFSLLGGLSVYIFPGKSPQTVKEVRRVRGEPPPDLVTSLSKAGDTLSDSFASLEKKLSDVLAEVKKAVGMFTENDGTVQRLLKERKLYDDIAQVAEDLKRLSGDVREGKGTIGKLFADDSLYNDLKGAVTEIKTTVKEASDVLGKAKESIEQGKGLLGKIFTDEEVYENLKKASRDIEALTSKLRTSTETDSLLNQLLKPGGGRIFDDLSGAFADVKDLFSQIKEGKGLLHTLLYDENVSKDVKEAVASVKNVVKRLDESKEGSLWKLITEPELYEKAKKTLDDASEALAPIARLTVFVGLESSYYDYQKETASSIYLKIFPRRNRYFHLGVTFFYFDETSPVGFDLMEQEAGSYVNKVTFLMAQIFRFNDKDKEPKNDWAVVFRAGLLEGTGGGGIDFEFFERRLLFTLEGRAAHTDPNRFYEPVEPFLLRFRASYLIWGFLRVYVGVNNILDKTELSVGISVEWEDKDIKSIVGIAGAMQ